MFFLRLQLLLQLLILRLHLTIHLVHITELLSLLLVLPAALIQVDRSVEATLLTRRRCGRHVQQISQFNLSGLLPRSLLLLDGLLSISQIFEVRLLVHFEVLVGHAVDEFDDALQRSQIVLVLAREPVLVPEVLYELDVRIQVLQYLFLLDLQE